MPVSSPTTIVTLSAAVSPATTGTVSGSVTLLDATAARPAVGSAAGSVDGSFSLAGTVTAGTPVSIDLTALADPVGTALTVGHLVAIKVANTGSAGNLSYGGGSAAAIAAAPVAVSPGSAHLIYDAGGTLIPVAAGSTQYLQLTASAGTVPYAVTGLTRSA